MNWVNQGRDLIESFNTFQIFTQNAKSYCRIFQSVSGKRKFCVPTAKWDINYATFRYDLIGRWSHHVRNFIKHSHSASPPSLRQRFPPKFVTYLARQVPCQHPEMRAALYWTCSISFIRSVMIYYITVIKMGSDIKFVTQVKHF